MGGGNEEWVKAAMTDDTMVVDLLVRLHGAVLPPPPPAVPLEWTVRQRRSRPVTVKQARSQRATPSTPLSWSGATSLSGGSGGSGGGGYEGSSRSHIQNLSAPKRSKLNGDNEKSFSKMAKKKKTLVELKDEENSLIKERRKLKREISAVRVNLEKQRARNDKWKRMKVEFQLLPNKEATSPMEESVSDRLQADKATHAISGNAAAALLPSTFMLPDLNMPVEDPCPDVIICSVC